MSDRWFQAYSRVYSEGFQHGYERALAEVDAADDRMWADLARRVRKQAQSPRFSQLCDKRGEHARAEVARSHERSMGLELA